MVFSIVTYALAALGLLGIVLVVGGGLDRVDRVRDQIETRGPFELVTHTGRHDEYYSVRYHGAPFVFETSLHLEPGKIIGGRTGSVNGREGATCGRRASPAEAVSEASAWRRRLRACPAEAVSEASAWRRRATVSTFCYR